MGPGLLATKRAEVGGRRLTNDELRQLSATATVEDPVYVEDRRAADDVSKLTAEQIKASQTTTRVNEALLPLLRLKAYQ